MFCCNEKMEHSNNRFYCLKCGFCFDVKTDNIKDVINRYLKLHK